MTTETIQLLLDLLGQIRIAPTQPDASEIIKRVITAKQELEREIGNGLSTKG